MINANTIELIIPYKSMIIKFLKTQKMKVILWIILTISVTGCIPDTKYLIISSDGTVYHTNEYKITNSNNCINFDNKYDSKYGHQDVFKKIKICGNYTVMTRDEN